MKIKHFFGLAVIAAMTASCSSNEDLGTAGSGTNEAGVGYATFSINLPTTSGTRADGDPTFENGDANEYKVNDATLLIFKKGTPEAAEGDYTFVESAELGSMAPWKDPNETGVTTHAKITAKLEHVDKTDGYYALVLLNNGTGDNVKVTLPKKGDTFSVWNVDTNTNKDKEATNEIANTNNGFYMANAPLFNKNNVTTLVAIDKNKIYPTEEQAAKSAATDVYVERGLAKVTLKQVKQQQEIRMIIIRLLMAHIRMIRLLFLIGLWMLPTRRPSLSTMLMDWPQTTRTFGVTQPLHLQ